MLKMKKQTISMIVVASAIAIMLSACTDPDDISTNVSIHKEGTESKKIHPTNTPKSENIETDENHIIGDSAEDTANNSAPQPSPASSVEIAVVGDVMMDSYIGDYIREQGVDYPWSDVSSILKKADLAVANLETSVSDRGSTRKPQGFGFRSAPGTLQGLENSGIDLVSLANNHALDYGQDALLDTMRHLDDHEIRHAGAGQNLKEARRLVILERNGLKIGFLSYTSIIPWKSWIAEEDHPGLAPLTKQEEPHLLEHIRQSKSECDLLVVLLHWGKEYHYQPEAGQVELAHQMIDHGADAVIGGHPHVLQGIELYKNKPIIYSTGNFIFLKKNDAAGETAIFKLVFNQDGFVQGEIKPVYIKYCKANLLTSDDPMRDEIIQNLIKLSKGMGTVMDVNGQFAPAPVQGETSSPRKFPAATKRNPDAT